MWGYQKKWRACHNPMIFLNFPWKLLDSGRELKHVVGIHPRRALFLLNGERKRRKVGGDGRVGEWETQ